MRSLWERRERRGECGKYAIRGIWTGLAFALIAVAVSVVGLT